MLFSHKLLVQNNRAEVRRLKAVVRKAGKHGTTTPIVPVFHEKDESCCEHERWETTARNLLAKWKEKRKRHG